MWWWLDPPLLQVALTRQGMPAKALQAVRMLLASEQLHSQRSAADFAKQIDPLHEESCLQVLPIAADDLNIRQSPPSLFKSFPHVFYCVKLPHACLLSMCYVVCGSTVSTVTLPAVVLAEWLFGRVVSLVKPTSRLNTDSWLMLHSGVEHRFGFMHASSSVCLCFACLHACLPACWLILHLSV